MRARRIRLTLASEMRHTKGSALVERVRSLRPLHNESNTSTALDVDWHLVHQEALV